MKRWTYNLFEAMRLLGVKDARQPAIMDEAVVPTMVVGDVSNLAPPILAPTAWYGNYVTGVAGQYSGFSVNSRAAGGCHVRHSYFQYGGNAVVYFLLTSTVQRVLANQATARVMSPTTPSSVVYYGTNAAAPLTSWIPWFYNGNSGLVLPDLIFLPRGWWLTVMAFVPNQGAYYNVVVQDVPAAPGDV